MLRCTVAGMIPILMIEKYADKRERLFTDSRSYFDSILKSESYYILKYLPPDIAKKLAGEHMAELLKKQRKNGLWKVKDAERITYDIYAVLKHTNILDEALTDGLIKYDTLAGINDKYNFYSLLMKKNIFGKLTEKDNEMIASNIKTILDRQENNGSWGHTVTETSVNLENLAALGLDTGNEAVHRGCDYLFSRLNQEFPATHVGNPYGFTAQYMFSEEDRGREFAAAQKLKPEWIPRAVCFRHVGVIQNSVALIALIKLGFGENEAVIHAVDNLYDIYSKYHGFCDSDIKKKYVADNGIRL